MNINSEKIVNSNRFIITGLIILFKILYDLVILTSMLNVYELIHQNASKYYLTLQMQ